MGLTEEAQALCVCGLDLFTGPFFDENSINQDLIYLKEQLGKQITW